MAQYTMNDGIVERALLNINKADNTIPTGFSELDEKLEGGLQNGYLYVLGGRPAMGKTAFALNIAAHVLRAGKKVLYYSLQMPAEKLVKRMIINEAHGETGDTREAAEDIKKYDLILDTDSFCCLFGESLDEQINYDDISLMVIDDLQHISPSCETSDVCCLKEKAQQINIPILLITNLSESLDERHLDDRRPILPDLYNVYCGGSVAGYADVVLFLYRDEYYNRDTELKGIAEVIVAKNSTGQSGTCRLVYLREFMQFANIAKK